MSLALKHNKDWHNIQLQKSSITLYQRRIFMTLSAVAQLALKGKDAELKRYRDNIQFVGDGYIECDISFLLSKMNYTSQRSREDIYKYLEQTFNDLAKIMYRSKEKNSMEMFSLFYKCRVEAEINKVYFKLTPDYLEMLNKDERLFTLQLIENEYNKIKSVFSQSAYSLLKQWEIQKHITISIDDFKQRLGYTYNRMCDVDTRVLKVIKEDLKNYFPNLKIQKIKNGKKITDIKFSWTSKKESFALLEELEKLQKEEMKEIEFCNNKIQSDNEVEEYKYDNITFNNVYKHFKPVKGILYPLCRVIHAKNKDNEIIFMVNEPRDMTFLEYVKIHKDKLNLEDVNYDFS